MRARVTLALLAVTPAVAGCGAGHGNRAAVARYIDQVNVIEAQLSGPLASVSVIGSRFATSEDRAGAAAINGVAQERALLRALARIDRLRRRLAAIQVPAPAAHLRRLLLELGAGEARLTRELAELVGFLPPFARVLAALPPATAHLQTALVVNQPLGYGIGGVQAELAVKAGALRRYQRTLDSVVAQLRGLHPPPVSWPQYHAQIVSLMRMSAAAGRLAGALATGSGNLPALVSGFSAAASGVSARSALVAQAAAVRAYDARARRLAVLAQAVQIERARLGGKLH
jgi:hypothetical protein